MKKILKKVAATILAASMVIGMTACGTGGGVQQRLQVEMQFFSMLMQQLQKALMDRELIHMHMQMQQSIWFRMLLTTYLVRDQH